MGKMLDDVWDNESTHQEGLMYAVAATTGPVIELGAGYYSTPLLHGVCAATGRLLITVEGTKEWAERFQPWSTEQHRIYYDPEQKLPYTFESPGVVFIDHDTEDVRKPSENPMVDRILKRPGYTRGIRALEAKAVGTEIVVLHDTQPAMEELYPGLREAIGEFKYVREYMLNGIGAWTTLCSDYVDL